jgi:hypothetical protein
MALIPAAHLLEDRDACRRLWPPAKAKRYSNQRNPPLPKA